MGAVFQYNGSPWATAGASIASTIMQGAVEMNRTRSEAIGSAAKSIGMGFAAGVRGYRDNQKDKRWRETFERQQSALDARNMSGLGSIIASTNFTAENDNLAAVRAATLSQPTTPIPAYDESANFKPGGPASVPPPTSNLFKPLGDAQDLY